MSDPPKLELGDALANVLGAETKEILEDKYINSKEREDKTLKTIKEKYIIWMKLKMLLTKLLFRVSFNFSLVEKMVILLKHVTFYRWMKITTNLFHFLHRAEGRT